jgi:hypothetical protein
MHVRGSERRVDRRRRRPRHLSRPRRGRNATAEPTSPPETIVSSLLLRSPLPGDEANPVGSAPPTGEAGGDHRTRPEKSLHSSQAARRPLVCRGRAAPEPQLPPPVGAHLLGKEVK